MSKRRRILVGLFTVTVAVMLYVYWITDGLVQWNVVLRRELPGYGIHEGCVQEYVAVYKERNTFRKTLTWYRHFHSVQLRLLQSQSFAPVRTLIWACEGVCSGLGARMRSLEASFLLAVLSERVFGVYIGDINLPSMQYLEPNEIDWSSVYEPRQGMHKEADYIREKRSKTCDLSLLSLLESNESHLTFTVGMANALENCLSQLKNKLHEIGYELAVRGTIYRYLFKYSPQLLNRAQETMESLGLLGKKYLAIHMRTGFEGMDIQESPIGIGRTGKILQRQNQWKKSMDCALKLADKKTGMGSPIFLATDSYNAKEWAATLYGIRVRTVINITIVHVDKRKSWNKEDVGDQFLGTWVDIVLLSRAYILVSSSSGFSLLASDLCMIPSYRIYRASSCKLKPML